MSKLKNIYKVAQPKAPTPPPPFSPQGRPTGTFAPAPGGGAPAPAGAASGRFGTPPGASPPRGGAGTSAPSGQAGGGRGGNTQVIAMQQALQALAQDVTKQINLPETPEGADPQAMADAKARAAFGVFLAKNYMRTSRIKGVEFDPDASKTEMSQKSPDDPTNLSVVMDTMDRIGSPKPRKLPNGTIVPAEKFVDGAWGPRTDAAVRDAYAFASGLIDFVKDVNRYAPENHKVVLTKYDDGLLQKFEQLIKYSEEPAMKLKTVPYITEHIQAIKDAYEEVRDSVLEQPVYRQYIEAQTPYKEIHGTVTPQQIATLKDYFKGGFDLTYPTFKTNIKVSDLVSPEALQAWIGRAAPTAAKEGILTPQSVIDKIWQQNQQLLGPDQGI